MKQVGPAIGLFLLSCARPSPQEPAPGRLLFEDDFSDLRHWSVEGTGTATVQEGTFVWDASGTREGTAWCRQRFAGSTLVTYEVQVLDGRSNINFFAYARLESDGKDTLLESGAQRTGAYDEYHAFPNYLVTYLVEAARWRIRFRRNPGFTLLSETRIDGPEPTRWQKVAYAFAADGTIRLYLDGKLAHECRDASPLPLAGRHGLRTWRTRLRYRHFKVYELPGSGAPEK